MSGRDERAAWSEFWASQGNAGQGGCLPNALEAIEKAQRLHWQEFARRLPKKARVLDVATGNGTVLVKMRGARPDLKLTGVDSSPSLPPEPAGVRLRAGVRAEALPFPAASFDAVTSQFGYEYCDTAAASLEIMRVMKPGASSMFMIHHRDGPILAHNLPRREALRWAAGTSLYLERARALVTARRNAPIPTPSTFRQAPAEARRLFPGQSVAWEFVSAILQTLELGRTAPPAESLEVLETLERKAANEVARIDSLERAVCDRARIEAIVTELRQSGLETGSVATLREAGSDHAFAWIVSAAKPIK